MEQNNVYVKLKEVMIELKWKVGKRQRAVGKLLKQEKGFFAFCQIFRMSNNEQSNRLPNAALALPTAYCQLPTNLYEYNTI